MIINIDKKSLRERLINQRNFLYNQSSKKIIDLDVLHKFINIIEEMAPQSVGLYKNFGSELDTSELDKYLRQHNIEALYPKLINDEMFFVHTNSAKDFEKSSNGFYEPINHGMVSVPNIIITPALAIDQQFFRLGYGKGYYDRYIAKNKNSKYIAIILKNFILEKLPRDEWDSQINYKIEVMVPNTKIS